MKPAVRRDRKGCAIACIARIVRRKYVVVRKEATRLGIVVDDPKPWGAPDKFGGFLRAFA